MNVIFLYASKLQSKKHPTLRDINISRLTGMKQLLEKFLECYRRLVEFEKDCKEKFSSERLLQLVTSVQKKKGLLPDIETLVQDLDAITEWTQQQGSSSEDQKSVLLPRPKHGIDPEYDKYRQEELKLE